MKTLNIITQILGIMIFAFFFSACEGYGVAQNAGNCDTGFEWCSYKGTCVAEGTCGNQQQTEPQTGDLPVQPFITLTALSSADPAGGVNQFYGPDGQTVTSKGTFCTQGYGQISAYLTHSQGSSVAADHRSQGAARITISGYRGPDGRTWWFGIGNSEKTNQKCAW